MHMHT